MAIDRTVLHSYHFGLHFLKDLLQDIPEDKLTHQPHPGMNHPVWILGHLVTTMGFASMLAKASYQPPQGYQELFGMKSEPVGDAGQYPAMSELLAELDKAVAEVAPALTNIDEEALRSHMPEDGLRDLLPTVGDGLTFILNGHLWMHIGQLSAWRRACGMPPKF